MKKKKLADSLCSYCPFPQCVLIPTIYVFSTAVISQMLCESYIMGCFHSYLTTVSAAGWSAWQTTSHYVCFYLQGNVLQQELNCLCVNVL